MSRITTIMRHYIIGIFVLFTGCATQLPPPTEFEEAPLFGMVYDASGSAVREARITIDGVPGPISDVNGRFVISKLEYGSHIIEITAENHEPVVLDFSFLNKTQVFYARLYNAEQLFDQAEVYIQSDNTSAALQYIDRCLLLDNDYRPAIFLKAIAHYKEKKYKMGLAVLNTLYQSGTISPEIEEMRKLMEMNIVESQADEKEQ